MIFEVIVLNLREKNVTINLSIIQLHRVSCGGYTLSWHTNEYHKYFRIAKSDDLMRSSVHTEISLNITPYLGSIIFFFLICHY